MKLMEPLKLIKPAFIERWLPRPAEAGECPELDRSGGRRGESAGRRGVKRHREINSSEII